jgi:hypothetical protein
MAATNAAHTAMPQFTSNREMSFDSMKAFISTPCRSIQQIQGIRITPWREYHPMG